MQVSHVPPEDIVERVQAGSSVGKVHLLVALEAAAVAVTFVYHQTLERLGQLTLVWEKN